MTTDELIEGCTNEEFLRHIRDLANSRLQKVKDEKYQQNMDELTKRYVGKYLLLYGRHVAMTTSFPNQNDIKILYVKEISYAGIGKFLATGRMLHICIDDQCEAIKRISDNTFSSVTFAISEGAQIHVSENDIDKIVEPGKIDQIIKNAVGLQSEIIKAWKEGYNV
jgi:hypothetical protein